MEDLVGLMWTFGVISAVCLVTYLIEETISHYRWWLDTTHRIEISRDLSNHLVRIKTYRKEYYEPTDSQDILYQSKD